VKCTYTCTSGNCKCNHKLTIYFKFSETVSWS
jgi:hypothetical protein